VWDATTGRGLLALDGHGGGVTGVAFSPDGTRVASDGADRAVRVWDAATGQELLALKYDGQDAQEYPGSIGGNSVAFSPDGARIAAISKSAARVFVWDGTPRAEDAHDPPRDRRQGR
jgi:WD40 repeat protein